MKTNFSFALSVPLRASLQKLLLKKTTAGRRILSTNSFTLFEVILSMMLLSAAHVLLFMRKISHSSGGMDPRAA
jgi:hypothetical protein